VIGRIYVYRTYKKITVNDSCPPTKPTLLKGVDMIKKRDGIDEAILHRVKTTQCASISDVIRPFLLQRSESVLRARVRALELHKLIRTTRTKREVLCFGVVVPEDDKRA
jgi:hypothetical protein